MQTFKVFVVCSFLGIGLGSCSMLSKSSADNTKQSSTRQKEANKEKLAPVKSPQNQAYRTPRKDGAPMRNPDIRLGSNFKSSSGITINGVNTSQPYIAITFDDGPHAQHTPRLLDMLRQRNIKATFYMVGQNVRLYPHIVRRIAAEGHEVASHSWNHPNLAKMSDEAVNKQLQDTHNEIIKAAGVAPRTFRPPYGSFTTAQRQKAYDKFGYRTVLWSVDPYDWKKPGPSVVASRIVSGTRPGAIILVHDIHKSTIDAMPQTLDTLLRQGYKFVTVSQLVSLDSGSGGTGSSDTAAAQFAPATKTPLDF